VVEKRIGRGSQYGGRGRRRRVLAVLIDELVGVEMVSNILHFS
jgi:hypothetical protein